MDSTELEAINVWKCRDWRWEATDILYMMGNIHFLLIFLREAKVFGSTRLNAAFGIIRHSSASARKEFIRM